MQQVFDARGNQVLLQEHIDAAWELSISGKEKVHYYEPGTHPTYCMVDKRNKKLVLVYTPGDEVVLYWDGLLGHPGRRIYIYRPNASYWHNIQLSNIHTRMRDMAIRLSK